MYEHDNECSGSWVYPVSASSFSWSSSNSSVASVDTGFVSCLSPGNAGVTGTYQPFLLDDAYDNSGPEDCNCYTVPVSPDTSTSVAVQPIITGPNTVWYFGGQNPTGYATQITLSSSGGSGTTWTVVSGSNKVSLSTTTGAETAVTSTGNVFSSAVGDIKVKARANNVDSTEFSITSRTPYRWVAGSISTNCDATNGYLTLISYTAQDQLLAALPSDVPYNEKWTTGITNDFSGTNWRRGPEGAGVSQGSLMQDLIGGENVNLPPVPVPLCNGDSTAIQHWGQEWWVGSATIGVGRRAQTNTLQKYKGRAAHTSIMSPAP